MSSPRPDCWGTTPHVHPWLPIADMACGYDQRLADPGCAGCIRCRAESALQQLQRLDARHTEDGLAK